MVKKYVIVILWALFMSCSDDNPVEPSQSVDPTDLELTSQELIDELIALSSIDQGFIVSSSTSGEGGVYADIDFTTEATGNVLGWKGFGKNMWNTPNLIVDDLGDYSVVWYTDEGTHPQVVDRGDGDKYVRIRNGPSARYATNPGQIRPALSNPLDVIGVFRIYPQPNQEVDGLVKFVNTQSDWQITPGGFLPTGVSGGLFNRVYLRFTVDAAGNWALRLNDLSKSTPDATGTGYTISNNEHTIGSNGHPADEHLYFRAFNFREGGFSQSSLDSMQIIFENLWPLGKPSFPYDDGTGVTWNASDNSWTVNEGTFGGGNGEKGNYSYEWYYWNELDNASFPIGNKLDEHNRIDGQSGRTLDRDDISQIFTDGASAGSGDVLVMCIRTPRDSDGTEGEKISTTFVLDNR